ncbi:MULTISPECIES: amidase [unclassified Sphingomonas]|uniref:amidase n=1 Tax=unclassified Sphingomonas TaxID=196159 RepID=UPI000A81ED05|nr:MULTISPECIES: amidase [unclassified Sphingomonas]
MASDNIFVERFELGGTGPTVAVKDCIDIAGKRTSVGSEALADAPPAAAHAAVVAALLAGGARIVGKTNMHEFAYGVTGVNRWLGTPINPAYPDLIPGGSSSGSAAAVAAGLADIAIGTDTGGSIRMPATCCGVFGLKPSFGRVSREGCVPADSSLDCVGPFARNVAGLETAMALIDPTFVPAGRPASVRIGWVESSADPEIAATVLAEIRRSGAEVVPVDLPGLDQAFEAGITIMAGEAWSTFGDLVEDPRLGADVRARLHGASKVSATQLAEAEKIRTRFTAAVDQALTGVDALALPTLPALPPALDDLGDAARMLRLTALIRPFNVTGHPALTIPVAGRPIATQLVGRRNDDETLCAVAARLCEGIAA